MEFTEWGKSYYQTQLERSEGFFYRSVAIRSLLAPLRSLAKETHVKVCRNLLLRDLRVVQVVRYAVAASFTPSPMAIGRVRRAARVARGDYRLPINVDALSTRIESPGGPASLWLVGGRCRYHSSPYGLVCAVHLVLPLIMLSSDTKYCMKL